MAKGVIFDFDGTLADTLDIAIQFGNENKEHFSERGISKDDFRNLSMREVLKHIDLPFYKIPKFTVELKKYMKAHLTSVQLFPEIDKLLTRLKNNGMTLYVMSSNSRENIACVLDRYKVLDIFTEIYSDSSIFGKHQVLKKMLDQCKIDAKSVLYIGDEVRDFEACKRLGIDMLAVSWGWDSGDRLKKSGIQRVTDTVHQLEQMIG